jgi:hypothetical protein
MVGINMGNLARHNTSLSTYPKLNFFFTINTLKNNNSFTLLKDDNIVNTISIVDKFNITIFFFVVNLISQSIFLISIIPLI